MSHDPSRDTGPVIAQRPVSSPVHRHNGSPFQQLPSRSASWNQRPNGASPSPAMTRPIICKPPSWANDDQLKLRIRNLPPGMSTLSIYQALKQHGNLVKIDIDPQTRECYVVFKPPPKDVEWIHKGLGLIDSQPGMRRRLTFQVLSAGEPWRHDSPGDPSRKYAEETKIKALRLDFGVKKEEHSMLILHPAETAPHTPAEMVINLQRKVLDIDFAVLLADIDHTGKACTTESLRFFKVRLNFAQIKRLSRMISNKGEAALVISTETPPMVFRKTSNVERTHEDGMTYWTDWKMWYRQTDLDTTSSSTQRALTQLQKESAIIDIGRWLSYRLVFDQDTASSSAFQEVCDILEDYNVTFESDVDIGFDTGKSADLWNWLDNPTGILESASGLSVLSDLQQMAGEAINLPFEIRYQLEVCISHGQLHESNISKEFLAKLASMEMQRAVKLLEKVADEKERFFNLNDIFARLMHKVSIVRKKLPRYCATIRSATVTPTTIYFMSPVTEKSNRVIRRYQQYEDRFLRVKFTDEKYRGKLMSSEDDTFNEVFTRIKRTMTNGIKVGDRHYEFLAFGNSQFREHGAWFFASTGALTAQDIRDCMGDFTTIKNVAKYCSRIGQAFSTTRAIAIGVNRDSTVLPDIERNNFCFSDGVGKISPFVAQMIAGEFELPNPMTEYPSVIQFRLAGCKGVLAVDPSLMGKTVQIRGSQDKFAAIQHRGLEIIRTSRRSDAHLNAQLILVLSALGVQDHIFVRKMQEQLSDLYKAMSNKQKALEVLERRVDFNQMTVQLASILADGFMEADEPFVMSCLHLWRSHEVKYLKEKARILIDNGTFVLGCVDETATLRGHSNAYLGKTTQDIASLPQIFLQISNKEGRHSVVEGLCIVARNPSLHPGDVRVVYAVDVPALHHLRDCVVFPQTGDRDLPNMCSGGDLDGDDYLVMWDSDLLPQEWNHPPMDYNPPPPNMNPHAVTVDDMASFFVTYMKHENLSRIAVAHRYWADRQPDGVKDPICLDLAQRHSRAVDYVKTGVAAEFPVRLRVQMWPHWAEVKGKPKNKIYHSKKVLGKLYDNVQRVKFEPAWEKPFDKRVLNAYELDDEVLETAREAKLHYDEAMRRVMSQFSISNEFEVWTTFTLEHSEDFSNYKFAETIGEAVSALKDQHQKACYEQAGTTHQERDWSKMEPFIAAMYAVTAQEMQDAISECRMTRLVGGRWVQNKELSVETVPFISFPWLFPKELGIIANKGSNSQAPSAQESRGPRRQQTKKPYDSFLAEDDLLGPLPEATFPDRDAADSDEEVEENQHDQRGDQGAGNEAREVNGKPEEEKAGRNTPPACQDAIKEAHHEFNELSDQANETPTQRNEDSEDSETEEVTILFPTAPSALDTLAKMTGA